ncbi:hypothetical protein BDV93DRAFT_520943 [Ceratobasidium sp. AG-I]|nr:hypothetical protein BDV93DRAFT_520943 [Ceratobasidium sp. AG-I]
MSLTTCVNSCTFAVCCAASFEYHGSGNSPPYFSAKSSLSQGALQSVPGECNAPDCIGAQGTCDKVLWSALQCS